LSAAIKAQYGVEATLVKGSGGVFEVYKDGKLIHSKKQTGTFPTHEGILKLLVAEQK
jgi:selenoprotein W-related protein